MLLGVLVVARPVHAATDSSQPCATIPVEILDKVDSASAKVAERFRFRAIDTMVMPDGTKIPRGALGYGVVEFVSAAGAHGRPGQLLLEPRYFALAHGVKFQVTVDAIASTELHSGSSGNAPGIVGAMPVPFIGVAIGAFNYFHAGKNVTVPAGYRFAVTPVGDLSHDRHCRPEVQL